MKSFEAKIQTLESEELALKTQISELETSREVMARNASQVCNATY